MNLPLLIANIKFKIKKIKEYLNIKKEILILKFDQKFMCIHRFRPGIKGGNPIEICKYCDKINTLSKEEYFSKYGELNWQNWNK